MGCVLQVGDQTHQLLGVDIACHSDSATIAQEVLHRVGVLVFGWWLLRAHPQGNNATCSVSCSWRDRYSWRDEVLAQLGRPVRDAVNALQRKRPSPARSDALTTSAVHSARVRQARTACLGALSMPRSLRMRVGSRTHAVLHGLTLCRQHVGFGRLCISAHRLIGRSKSEAIGIGHRFPTRRLGDLVPTRSADLGSLDVQPRWSLEAEKTPVNRS